MKKIILFTALFASLQISYGQSVHFTDSTGRLFWKKDAPVYIFFSDNPEGNNSKKLENKKQPRYTNPVYLDIEGVNYLRTRDAVDNVTLKSIPETDVIFEIYADGRPPQSKITYFNRVQFKSDSVLFVKSGLKAVITSIDNLSGVSDITYSVNGQDFTSYNDTLFFDKVGSYEVKYSAIDRVGNIESPQTVTFYVDAAAPISEVTINGITEKQVISTSSTMYLQSYDSISGVGNLVYKFDQGNYLPYNGKLVPFSSLSEGEHTLFFYATDKVGNKEQEKSFTFYLDKSAPIMVADVLGDRFIVGDQIYFSGRTKLKLTAVDNKVGVKELLYSIDEGEFQPYKQPIYLPSLAGLHTIKYYSVDNLNNSTVDSKKSQYLGDGGFEEFKHNVNKIYVDLTGPIINYKILDYQFVREDTLYIGPYSKIQFSGNDSESGLQQITYAINNEVRERSYTEPFTLDLKGYNTLHFYGYDNVNNRNVNKVGFVFDKDAPEIFIRFNTGPSLNKSGNEIYPIGTGIFLSATDEISGVNDLEFELDKGKRIPYAGMIKNIGKGKHTIKVYSKDLLNNEGSKELEFVVR